MLFSISTLSVTQFSSVKICLHSCITRAWNDRFAKRVTLAVSKESSHASRGLFEVIPRTATTAADFTNCPCLMKEKKGSIYVKDKTKTAFLFSDQCETQRGYYLSVT